MAVYQFEDRIPKIGASSYISKAANVIGDVTIGEGCFIGPGAQIKGDYGTVKIGDNTSIQENCVVHARPDEICVIGSWINVGHGAILHNCTVKDWAVIGMGAIISDYAEVGEWGVVGEGAVVKNGQKLPDNSIAVGIPAKVIGEVKDEYKGTWTKYKEIYVGLARRYKEELKELEFH